MLKDIEKYLGFGNVIKGNGKCYTYTTSKLDEIEKIGNIFYNNCGFSLKRKKKRFDDMPKKTKYKAFGQIKTLSEWSRDKRCVVHKDSVLYRINHTNMSMEEILTTPAKSKAGNMYQRNKTKDRKHTKNHYTKYNVN